MRKTILAAAAVLTLAGAVAAIAQPASPPGPRPEDGPPSRGRQATMGHTHHGHRDRLIDPRAFSLVWPRADRNLSPADVQKIAEAFLLWRGNHTWKVVNVAPTEDQQIGFAIATPENSIIARFKMDPHTGRVTRVG